MTNVLFIRRPRLGYETTRGLADYITENSNHQGFVWTCDRPYNILEGIDVLIRWGCTANRPIRKPTINWAQGIHAVSDKAGFSWTVHRNYIDLNYQPYSVYSEYPYFSEDFYNDRFVVRPRTHSQGRNLFVVEGHEVFDLVQGEPALQQGWYARQLIDKALEYRVYVICGRVVCVSQKIPEDPTQVAWNHHQGSSFRNVRWSSWPLDVCQLAVDCHNLSGLHTSGIDVMVSTDGIPYFIEANSAPTMTRNSDGSFSYELRCFGKGLIHHLNSNWGTLEVQPDVGWRGFIHPGVQT